MLQAEPSVRWWRGLAKSWTKFSQRFQTLARDQWAVLVILSLTFSAAFAVRYLVIVAFPAPPGSDYGNYLTNLHTFSGRDVSGAGLQYPLLFIAYLWVITGAFGELGGLMVSGPLLGALLCVPAYVFLRNFVGRPYAAAGAAMLAFTDAVSEMIGWGGNANLLGMLFGTFFMAWMLRYMSTGDRRFLVASAVAFAGIAGSHQVSLAYFAFVAVLMVALLMVSKRNRTEILRPTVTVAAGSVLALPFLSFYLHFFGASTNVTPSALFIVSLSDIAHLLTWVSRDSLIVWAGLTALALLGYKRMASLNRLNAIAGVTLLIAPVILALTVMALHPARPFYFLFLGVLPGALYYLECFTKSPPERLRFRRANRMELVGMSVAISIVVVLLIAGHQRMVAARDWYFVLEQDVLEGLDWLQTSTRADAVVATDGPVKYGSDVPTGCLWGWWIEGYARRKTLCTADTKFLAWRAQSDNAIFANRAFAGTLAVENGRVRAGEFAPYGHDGNPLVSANFGFGYEPFVDFSDATTAVVWHEPSNLSVRTDVASELPERSMTKDQAPESVRIRATAKDGQLVISRSLEIRQGSDVLRLDYLITAPGLLEEIRLGIFGTTMSRLVQAQGDARRIDVVSAPGFRSSIRGTVTLGGDASVASAIALTNSFTGNPGMLVSLSPASGSTTAFVSLELDPETLPTPESTPVVLFSSLNLFEAAGVDFVFVDSRRNRELAWIGADQASYRLVFANAAVTIFEVAS